MKKNAKRTVVVIALIALLAIPGLFAYFTDTDSVDNVFTVGNVEIDLVESGDGTEIKEDGVLTGMKWENVAPGKEVQKAPVVKNTGRNDAYVFLEVLDNEYLEYTYDSTKWTKLGDDYPGVYYYGVNELATVAALNGETDALFSKVVVGAIEEQTAASELHLKINAYAIQTTDLGEDVSKETPVAVWGKVKPVTP